MTELVEELEAPRVVWLMVPAGDGTESVIEGLVPLLAEGDSIIDGGNSNYKDSNLDGIRGVMNSAGMQWRKR